MAKSDRTGRVAKDTLIFPPSSGSSTRISCFETPWRKDVQLERYYSLVNLKALCLDLRGIKCVSSLKSKTKLNHAMIAGDICSEMFADSVVST